jgi:hypothetical protein
MMAMATGCAGSCARDANPPIADAAAGPGPIILLDAPVGTPVDTRAVDVQPLPHESCAADGAPTASLALDASCDVYALADAVRQATNWYCDAIPSISNAAYAVVIDCDGRAIELLSLPNQTPLLSGAERQAWLDSLANDRWPCYAGQSVQFTCIVCLFPP